MYDSPRIQFGDSEGLPHGFLAWCTYVCSDCGDIWTRVEVLPARGIRMRLSLAILISCGVAGYGMEELKLKAVRARTASIMWIDSHFGF